MSEFGWIPACKGNSPAAMAGRAARIVRVTNAWKVRAGLMSQRELRRWAKRIERECRAAPWEFAHWGVVRGVEPPPRFELSWDDDIPF